MTWRPHVTPRRLRCDLCRALTPIETLHTPHEAGCGYDDPDVGRCACDHTVCPACCNCDLPLLLEDTR